jgi:hypothetical protein
MTTPVLHLSPGASRLPLELCEFVIDYVAGYYDLNESISTLLACCLTCRAWVPRSRRHLYCFGIVIKTGTQLESLKKRLLSPSSAHEIRNLDVGYNRELVPGEKRTWIFTIGIKFDLRALSHMRCLRLACIPGMEDVLLLQLKRFPALTGLLLYGCTFKQFTHLARIVSSCKTLTQLYVNRLEWPEGSFSRDRLLSAKCREVVRLEVLNMSVNSAHVVANTLDWLLYTPSYSTLHTVSFDFPAPEPRDLVPNAVARFLVACGSNLMNLRLRFDTVPNPAGCAHILSTFFLSLHTWWHSPD